MKKLFALISLLGLVAGMGGTLNAQEASGDTQGQLDTIVLYSYFQNLGEAQTLKFKFSATPGEKFIIHWKGYYLSSATDTISVESEKEIEATYTFTSDYTHSHPTCYFVLAALAPTGHIKNLRIDSTYKYRDLTFKNCILLDTIQVSHNALGNLSIWNCPLLRFLDISHNKLTGWYQEITSALTYLDCSHNNIRHFYKKDLSSLQTFDISYNRRLEQLMWDNCQSLTDLTVRCNDSLETLDLSNLPLQHLTCTENQKLSRINAVNCRFPALDVSGNPALERLDCNNNQLTSLMFNDCPALAFINCSYNQLSHIDLSLCKNLQDLYCRNNRFSVLDVPKNMILTHLDCDSNHIPLSVLVDLIDRVRYRGNVTQVLTVTPLQVGEFLDLRDETHLSDCYQCERYIISLDGKQIEERLSDGLQDDYGLIKFDKAGNYRLHLRSDLLYEREEGEEEEGQYYITIAANYDLTVVDSVVRPQFSIPSGAVLPDTELILSTPTPDTRIYYTTDGSEPDETALAYTTPIRISEPITVKAIAIQDTFKSHIATANYTIDSVANENDLKASDLRVYAKDRTIYLSEAVGKVEVFTVDGHCVYRGFDTAIPMGKRGLYIVSAAGRGWKVSVR